MFSTKAPKTHKVRLAFTALLSTIVGAMLAMGPASSAAAVTPEAEGLAPLEGRFPGLSAAGLAAKAPVSLQAGEGQTYFNGADRYGTRGGFAVGYSDATGELRPATGEFGTSGYDFKNAADPGVSSGLSGVSALARNSAVAVGWHVGDSVEPLIERYAGDEWRIVQAPSVPGGMLLGVDALAADNVYAVGTGPEGQLIMHFDGTAWNVMPGPSLQYGTLVSVEALGPYNIWAVGYYFEGGVFKTLVQHFDGYTWAVVPSPNKGTQRNMLSGITALSAGNIWAVGYYNSGAPEEDRTLVEHFNGRKWTIVRSPNRGDGANALWAVDANGARDVWAVGETTDGTLAVRFDGDAWKVDARTLRFTRPGDSLYGVAGLRGDDVYAVGGYVQAQFGPAPMFRSLIHRYNGKAWTNIV